ncbi:Dephospho-CoA kinase [Phycisphaerales bacterium]|nr:Dephospho-CoA kinase [Phycisphaerales bacterium]
MNPISLKPARRSILVRSLPAIVKGGLLFALGVYAGPIARANVFDSAWWIDGPKFVGVAWIGFRVLWEVLLWNSRLYTLSETHLTARSGVLRRITTSVPLENVQQAVLDRLFIERLTGLGTICITTAGSQTIIAAWVMISRAGERLVAILKAVEEIKAANAVDRAGIQVIGLAGGVGSGKSEVARLLGEMGYLVIDSDQDAKAALDRPDVLGQIVTWWGKEILLPNGKVNRRKVADIVFKDPAERARLEGLVHPIVKRDRVALIARAKAEGKPGVVVDAPLLFEAGSDKDCDYVLFVDAPRKVRLARIRDTRGWDEAELNRRENVQVPLEAKKKRSDVVIVNDSDTATLRSRVQEGVERLRALPRRRANLSKP